MPVEAVAGVDESGHAVVELGEHRDVGAPIEFRVVAPDGEVLYSRTIELDQLGSPMDLQLEPKRLYAVGRTDDPRFGKPDRVRGRVIDATAAGQISGAQVVLWARSQEATQAAPIAVGRTDGQGYFFVDYPLGQFAEAYAVIGSAQPVPIQLAADGGFPHRLVLLVDLGTQAEKDCGCAIEVPRLPGAEDLAFASGTYTADLGSGQCVEITKPNRTLEEFDFFSVVRTTEPQIKGMTLTPPPKVGAKALVGLLSSKILASIEAGAKTMAQRAMPAAAPAKAKTHAESSASHTGDETVRLSHPSTTHPAAGDILDEVEIDVNLAKVLAQDPDGFSLTRLGSAELMTNAQTLMHALDLLGPLRPSRAKLTCGTPVDWDIEPTFYQACTIAHGHLLHFKQVWKADGYSLGDLLYSLPLAPAQKKQIAVIDWERRESTSRSESLEAREEMDASLSRDRDISEIAHASVRERIDAHSESDTESSATGLGHAGSAGGSLGGMLSLGGGIVGGVSFGNASASSDAWQKASRKASADSMQSLRDRTMQAASAVRSLRSTVVQAVRQGETVRVQTEVVANHNHCHAMTMEYFEVLRHFLVEHELGDVRECLLVPLLMSRFDPAKALRWRNPLRRFLRDRSLRGAFESLERIMSDYAGSDLPTGAYADEELTYLDGWLRIEFRLKRPRDEAGEFHEPSWGPLEWLLGDSMEEYWLSELQQTLSRDKVFRETMAPKIAEEIANNLQFSLVDENEHHTPIPVDVTIVDDFLNSSPLYASLRLSAALPAVSRKKIKFLHISDTLKIGGEEKSIGAVLPTGSKVIIRSGQVRYRTKHLAHDLFHYSKIDNDLGAGDPARIYTPLAHQELRRPRDEDIERANKLLAHVNEYLEHYHRVIWASMDAQRRYMLLDGFLAPNSGGRSVASVVENRLVGIVGNCLVLPVAPGNHLDPTYQQDIEDPIDLIEHYQPSTRPAPLRISVPTRGVFAEAVMGSCNSCEKKDESRFWRWEESPSPDEPTPIQAVSTASRRAEPPDMTAAGFPQPIIAMQNAPAAPDPTGYGPLLSLIGKPDIFRDLSGLTENQKNALAALQRAFSSTEYFGGKAAELAAQAQQGAQNLALQGQMGRSLDKVLSEIDAAHAKGAIDDGARSTLYQEALRAAMGGGATMPKEDLVDKPVIKERIERGADDAVHVQTPGQSVDITPAPGGGSGFTEVAAITDVLNWTDLITFRPPAPIVSALAQRGFTPQYLEDGWGLLNVDRYEVRVVTPPQLNGATVTPQELLKLVRLNINDFVKTRWATFTPHDPAIDTAIWTSATPTGSVIYIDMAGFDNGEVVTAEHAADHWIFSTIAVPEPALPKTGIKYAGVHPVSGNRMFGFRYTDQGLMFYTRGADRTSGPDIPENIAFTVGHWLWQSLQDALASFINSHGGVAHVMTPYSKRHDWSAVKLMFPTLTTVV